MKLKDELKSKRWDLADMLDQFEELSAHQERLTDVASKVKIARKLAKLGDAIVRLQDETDSLEKACEQAEIERARPLAKQAAKECVELFETEIQALDELLAAWRDVWAKTAELHEAALNSRDAWLVARDACFAAGESAPTIPNFDTDTMNAICMMKNEYQAKFNPAYEFCVNKIQSHELTGGKQTHRQERRHSLSLHVFGSR